MTDQDRTEPPRDGASTVISGEIAAVEVCPNVNLYGPSRVGLIAVSHEGKGWAELSPADARLVAVALLRAARLTEAWNTKMREAGEGS